MDLCNECVNRPIEESLKPEFCDYFLCSCYGTRQEIGFGPELEHWSDKMCIACAEEKDCCRRCGTIQIPFSSVTHLSE